MENYLVKAQFGHVGRNHYIIKIIPVRANDGKEAASIVRWMPRAKHNRKDAISDVRKVSYEEYLEQLKIHRNDPYFKVHNKQDQNKLCINIVDLIVDYGEKQTKINKTKRINKVKFKMKKNKIIYQDAMYEIRNYDVAMAF